MFFCVCGGEGTPIYRYVPRDRFWFLGVSFLAALALKDGTFAVKSDCNERKKKTHGRDQRAMKLHENLQITGEYTLTTLFVNFEILSSYILRHLNLAIFRRFRVLSHFNFAF